MRTLALVLLAALATSVEVSVGPGRGLTRIQDALPTLRPGDTLLIHPPADGAPYTGVALRIDQPDITVRGAPALNGTRPVLDGTGTVYRGEAGIPRAIIEFGPEALHGAVIGLTLRGARNRTGDAAAIRVDRTDGVSIEDCEISDCDQGVCTEGDARQVRGFRLSRCRISGCGAPGGTGRSHNLSLHGAEARITGCRIEGATDGSNLQSRTHRLLIEGCVFRQAAQRELDLVDAVGVTDQATSFALIVGCVLEKAPACPGNRSVIHFGQDGGADRTGTLYLVHCTLVSPYSAPVLDLSAPGARAVLANVVIADPTGGGANRTLVGRRGRGTDQPDWCGGLWLPYGYAQPQGARSTVVGAFGDKPPFHDPAGGDWRWSPSASTPFVDGGIDLDQCPLPIAALAADHPLRQRPRRVAMPTDGPDLIDRPVVGPPDLGAFERTLDP